jgi:ParB family transcriptional regulator, chromosome partitioning protein
MDTETNALTGKFTPAATTDIDIELIRVFSRRPIDQPAVERLAHSIARQGLMTPIDVVRIETGILRGRYKLIAGAHRLEACIRLGSAKIKARILAKDDAVAWEEAENLLRSGLTVLDESIAIVRYARRLKLGGSDAKPTGGRQPHDKGYAKLARTSGFSRKRVAEAYAHDALTDKVKSRVMSLGLQDSRMILTQVAKLPTAAEQMKFLDRRADPKNGRTPKTEKPETAPTVTKVKVDSVSALKAAWENSYFKKTFDREPKDVQRAFLRSLID